MIPWKTFKGRRKIDLVSLIEDANITTYEGLVEHLAGQSVGAPSKGEFDSALETPQAKSAPKPTTSKKTTRRSKAAQKKVATKDNPDEVWQDGLEGSYQSKKTRKPRATRKTTPHKKS